MKTLPILLLLSAFGAGCATESSSDILLGQWGGEVLGIRATTSSVVITTPCGGKGSLPAPVPLDQDGGFSIETVIHQFYGDYAITVEGRRAGRYLEVKLYTSRPGTQTPTYLLISGLVPDFTDYVCLGAPS